MREDHAAVYFGVRTWPDEARQTNLPLIVTNSRFLILPWTKIPNLASHILARAAQQLPQYWQAHLWRGAWSRH